MSLHSPKQGSAPVGHVSDLDAMRAAAVLYFRLWNGNSDNMTVIHRDWALALGAEAGQHAQHSIEALCDLCQTHGRRPLMRHDVMCNCLGADEACFANFIATAAEGDREDAMLIATLLVRADMAPVITALACEFGLALKRMSLGSLGLGAKAAATAATVH